MARCNVYSAARLHALALLMLSVSRVLLINGQVGSCTGIGCSCTSGYQCCLAVKEEASMALVGSATISQAFADVSLTPGHNFFISVEDASLFTINSSGVIRTSRAIDRESEDSCILITVAAVITASGRSQQTSQQFAIDIEDINDHKPEFMQQSYTFQVPETLNSQPVDLTCPTYQSQLTAVDRDNGPNSQITYSIVSGSDYFMVESDSPCIQNSQELDFETNRSFTVVLEARDNGMPPLSSNVTITFNLENLNDNPPRFTAPPQGILSVSVPENETPGSLVYRFMAVTADTVTNEIHFAIRQLQSPPQTQSSLPFEINRTTGEMTVNSTLNFEANARYDFKIEAIAGQQSSVMVTVMIEDINEPAIIRVTPNLSGPMSVVENELDPPVRITIRITDSDSEMAGNRNNTIRFVTGGEYFVSGQFQSLISVWQNVGIDREVTGDRFNLVVELIEGNNPLLHRFFNATVQVGDVNDNAPHLTREVFYYTESDASPRTLTTLGNFVVDPDNGTNGTVSSYELISVVNQDGRDLTDRFISVNVGSGRHLLSSGQLLAPALDRERDGPSLNITMNFTDDGDPQMSAVITFLVEILDVNDNPPQFTNTTYVFSFPENFHMNTFVGCVFASDPDNGENGTVIYTIIDGSNFTIDSQSGEIKTQIVFDREAQENYTIIVGAHDNSSDVQLTSTAIVIVMISDENDNPPVFTEPQRTFPVPSDTAVGTSIGRVEATDRDIGENAIVRYQISPSVPFSINSATGDITVAEDLSTQEGTLTVNVTAYNPGAIGLEESFLTINITITAPEQNTVAPEQNTVAPEQNTVAPEQNTVAPEQNTVALATCPVPSDTAVGTNIGRVEATDRDIGENAIVRYQISPSVPFSINSATGDITVAEDLSTQEGTLTVNVTAYNPGAIGLEESFLTINITITAPEQNTVALAAAVSSGLLLLLIVIVLFVIICLYYNSRRGKHSIATGNATLNNRPLSKPQQSILHNNQPL